MLVACLIVVSVISLPPSQASGDSLGDPSVVSSYVARIVSKLMQSDHLLKQPLNDEISSRAFELFAKSLDPMKVYFMQSDIDEFSISRTELDDQLKRGEFSTAFAMYRRFLQRVDQRTSDAVAIINQDHDFSIKEEMITDPDLLSYAKSEKEAKEKWRKRIKYSLLLLKNDDDDKDDDNEEPSTDTPASNDSAPADDEDADSAPKKVKAFEEKDPKEVLRARYQSFARRMHQTNSEELIEIYVSAITNAYDPHTSYMSPKSFEDFRIMLGLELEGIGATLSMSDDGYTVIKSIVPGGACDTQGGLFPEDKIVAVGQGNPDGSKAYRKLFEKHGGEMIDVVNWKLGDVVAMIRGKAGTVVRLAVISEGEDEIHTVSISREKIKLEDSAARGKVFQEGTRPDGTPQKFGVIELPSFYADMSGKMGGRSTTNDVNRILDDFNSQNVDALVLDLRRNGGGSLREAIDLTGLFIDQGTVVQVKDSSGRIVQHDDNVPGLSWHKPIVVLTSKFSASASEILAGAIQDYDRGIIVGDEQTHGKGTVQSLLDLNSVVSRIRNPPNTFGALKITMQQFYRPNGDSTQKRGVVPDIVLPSVTSRMDIGEVDLDYAVEFDRIEEAPHDMFQMRSPQIKQKLNELSIERVNGSDDFKDRKRRINKYSEQKALKKVSLNQEEFLARRKELSAEKEDKKTFEEQTNKKEIERDFYMDEVLKITDDYVTLLSGK
jgi:carboxyl-terminal processing protease